MPGLEPRDRKHAANERLAEITAQNCLCLEPIWHFDGVYSPTVGLNAIFGRSRHRLSRPARESCHLKWPDVAAFEQHLDSYLDQRQAGDTARAKVLEHWKQTNEAAKGPALLERVLSTASLVEPRIADLVSRLNDPGAEPVLAKQLPWLSSDVPAWLQDALRLAIGRNLAQRRLYDEALETLVNLDMKQVCDPASLVFYRAVCQHHLLQKKECVTNVEMLLERKAELPAGSHKWPS